MSDPLAGLPPRERKGSRARCLLLTYGADDVVARRLAELTAGHATVDPGRHRWAPRGVHDGSEPELGKTPPFLCREDQRVVSRWWLAARPDTARTPNWDIVSQATIAGREGLILIEAKAHAGELRSEEGGKRLAPLATADSHTNHQRIGVCIDEASVALGLATNVRWQLSRDRCYQMSNRFAWAWKAAELRVPVVLVYLGFLNAGEMPEPIPHHTEWEHLVKSHSRVLFPDAVWGRAWDVNGVPLIPVIQSRELPLRVSAGGFEA